MEFTVAEVAKILNVDGKAIKDWSYHFSNYLSSSANPAKGIARQYSIEDVRVLAYISMYWEDTSEIDSIKWSLNAEEYYRIDLINSLIEEITPVFSEPNDNDLNNENLSTCVLFAGMVPLADILLLANSYKLAADMIVDNAVDRGDPYDYICPIMNNYRHAIELYLKFVIGKEIVTHNLLVLYNSFEEIIKNEFGVTAPTWLQNLIMDFNNFDPYGTTFRYGGEIKKDEILISLSQLKKQAGWFAKSINEIHNKRSL